MRDTIQLRNVHTYPLTPFESAHTIGLRYDADQFPRVKTLRVTDGEPLPRGENVDEWPVDPPVNLGTLSIAFRTLPQGCDEPSSFLVSTGWNSNNGSTATAGTILRKQLNPRSGAVSHRSVSHRGLPPGSVCLSPRKRRL